MVGSVPKLVLDEDGAHGASSRQTEPVKGQAPHDRARPVSSGLLSLGAQAARREIDSLPQLATCPATFSGGLPRIGAASTLDNFNRHRTPHTGRANQQTVKIHNEPTQPSPAEFCNTIEGESSALRQKWSYRAPAEIQPNAVV
jgi:hypothetical protein